MKKVQTLVIYSKLAKYKSQDSLECVRMFRQMEVKMFQSYKTPIHFCKKALR